MIAKLQSNVGAYLVSFTQGVEQASFLSVPKRFANVGSVVSRILSGCVRESIGIVAGNRAIVPKRVSGRKGCGRFAFPSPQHRCVIATGKNAIAGSFESRRKRIIRAVA